MTSDHGITITWLGHATVKIETPDGKTILIDPWVSNNPKTPEDKKDVGHVDLMLITHAHFDHTADAVTIGQEQQPDVIAIFEYAEYLKSKGIKNANGVNKGGTVHWNGVDITMVDAVHSAGFEEDGTIMYGGTAAGYVLRFQNGLTVYDSGDTDVFESMRLIRRLYEPDVAILPIGGHFTMDPRLAAEAIRLLGIKTVIPVHYGTFPLLTGTPDQLEQEAKDVANLRVIALEPGESVQQSDLV